MRALRYLLALLFIPLAFTGVHLGQLWAFGVPIVAFLLVPGLELVLGTSTANLDPSQERSALANRIYDTILYSVVPLHYGLVIYFLHRVSIGALEGLDLVGSTWSVGIACGAYGINVAHELGHRKRPFEQALARVLLLTSLYMHFFIEHNRGHHKRVATPEDPATARYGETVYGFWLRSVLFGYLSAWQIEADRLRRGGRSPLSLQNQMVRFQIAQIVAIGAVGFFFGLTALVAFLFAALIGVLLLETINYLEHYGLVREQKDGGRYEYVLPAHSWNSDHVLGRMLLFELTRHSDHHANVSRQYQVLRRHDASPQLPTGYPGMMLLALLPPLWFAVMHRRIEAFRRQVA